MPLNGNDWKQLRVIAREEAQRMLNDEPPRSVNRLIPDIVSRMTFDDTLKWLTIVHEYAGPELQKKPRRPFIETNMKL